MRLDQYTGMIAAIAAAATVSAAHAGAETDLQAALDAGATQLTSDQIAERFTGHTATFEAASGDKTFLVHYGENNDISGRLVGGDWTGAGFYGVADDDSICLSWDGQDAGRLRCLDVLVVDGVVQKYRADGSLFGSIATFEDGKIF